MPHRVLGSAARDCRDILRGATATQSSARGPPHDHDVGVDVFCAIVAVLLERHSQQTEIRTLGAAAFWTTTQLLTVSSWLKNPISGGGRILGVLMEIYAITVVAGLAGSIGTFFQTRREDQGQALSDPATRAGPTGHPIPPAATRTVDPRLRRLGGVSSARWSMSLEWLIALPGLGSSV
jgi:hypothetical protein